MQKNLLVVDPIELSKVWPLIRDEVATIETPDGFIPEDVYNVCKQGGGTLFLLMIDGKRVGWTVVRLMLPDLHIWQLKADNGYDVMETFRPELMELARGARATKLTFGSTKQAWAKVAPKHKFRLRMVVYECDVEAAPAQIVDPAAVTTDGGADNDQHVTH